ncbi:MAG: hypothetical protein CMM56_05130 [Rhodospirillaceae bacterium]|nr:hypothetical protein [Rhodospirillaceae bacterium]|tara:strand:+ start:906 stop:3302 length:2397 start_codon:yes stop_codon:yes gene_type:complete
MLSGIRVLDFTDQSGWIAGRILADLGAEVTKVESPNSDLDDSFWRAHNLNKALMLFNLEQVNAQETLYSLVSSADILIESTLPGSREFKFFEHKLLHEKNRSLIHVAITPFGQNGPRSDWLASDLELMAAGGAMSLTGEADGEPVRISRPQSYGWAGVAGAAGALTALCARDRTGRGQLVDVSVQATIVSALANAPTFWDLQRTLPMRDGAFITGRSISGARYRVFWECKDGYINFILYGGSAGRRTNKALIEWMKEEGSDPGVLQSIDWLSFSPTELTQKQVDEIERPIQLFMARLTKRDFLDGACKREMLGYPVSTVADINDDPQLSERSFWSYQIERDGSLAKYCGGFAIVDGERLKVSKNIDSAQITTEEFIKRPFDDAKYRDHELEVNEPSQSALSGTKVVVFGGYAAGPWIGKILANFGADVVHVESLTRPDGFRLEYPPFKDGRRGVNRGGTFTFFNDSKLGITLDLKKPGGVELAKRLIDWSDVLIENMRPGVIKRLGLDYAELLKTNPSLIQLSTCNMGQTGRRSQTPGFGSQLSAMAGFSELSGQSNGPPMLLYGPYIDFIAAFYGTSAVLAALTNQKNNHKGCLIDLSQYECGVSFLAGELLDFNRNGIIAGRIGNADDQAVPHGVYRCSDMEWLAISCWSNSEFFRLAKILGKEQWCEDDRFSTCIARRNNIVLIEAAITNWCSDRTAELASVELQASYVHAYAVNTVADLFTDPQLAFRNTWRVLEHPVIGEQSFYFPGFDLSETPGEIINPGPLLGADNKHVYQNFLGLTETEMARYRANGVIT